jgi:hypothetical protein
MPTPTMKRVLAVLPQAQSMAWRSWRQRSDDICSCCCGNHCLESTCLSQERHITYTSTAGHHIINELTISTHNMGSHLCNRNVHLCPGSHRNVTLMSNSQYSPHNTCTPSVTSQPSHIWQGQSKGDNFKRVPSATSHRSPSL